MKKLGYIAAILIGLACVYAATQINLQTQVKGLLPIANGGTGTATPALVAGTNVNITGSWPNQTINSTSGGGLPNFNGSAFFNKRLDFPAWAGTGTLLGAGLVNNDVSSSGTINACTAANTGTAGMVRYFASTAGAFIGHAFNASSAVQFGHNLYFGLRMGVSTASNCTFTATPTTAVVYWMGLTGNYNTTLTDVTTANFAGFKWSTLTSDVNWQAVVSNGTTSTTVDTGVALDHALHYFEIREYSSAGTASEYAFYIDGSKVADVTNNTYFPSGNAVWNYRLQSTATTLNEIIWEAAECAWDIY